MRTSILAVAGVVVMTAVVTAQPPRLERLPASELDIAPPSTRVSGPAGNLAPVETGCRARSSAALRRRIVDVAAQEWGFFGFSVVDQTGPDEPPTRGGRRRPRLSPSESARVADSIAGYWTVTPEGEWIIANQNRRWDGSPGSTRWRTPWSAAFVSWVMCESGLVESGRFRRAVAHHTYIDQAIRARDGDGGPAAFTAYDIGESEILPGDLLCSGRRPAYRSVAERRRQMGEGARTHCDVVVALDEELGRILTIGGNVRGTVSLKLVPAVASDVGLRPDGGSRPLFAHLKLGHEPIAPYALGDSPTMRVLGCGGGAAYTRLVANRIVAPRRAARC